MANLQEQQNFKDLSSNHTDPVHALQRSQHASFSFLNNF